MIDRIPQRTRDEERLLIERAQRGDAKAVEELVRATYGLVLHFAKRMRTHQHALDDLISVGCEGILHAIRAADPSHAGSFATYATHWIRAKMHRYALADTVIHFPFRRKLSMADHGVSLDEPLTETDEFTRHDIIISDAPSCEDVVGARRMVGAAMRALSKRECIVLTKRFGEESSFDDIGAELSVSGARIQQIQDAALQKLRTRLSVRLAPKHKRQVTCRRCGETGHYKSTCRKPERAALKIQREPDHAPR